MTKQDPIERAKSHAASMYPDATIKTRSIRGRPVVLAVEENLIRLVRLEGPRRKLAAGE